MPKPMVADPTKFPEFEMCAPLPVAKPKATKKGATGLFVRVKGLIAYAILITVPCTILTVLARYTPTRKAK